MIEMGTIWDRTIEFIGDHVRAITPIALLALWLPVTVSTLLSDAAQGCAPALNPMIAGIAGLVLALVTLWAQLALTALALERGAPAGAATRAFGGTLGAMLLLFVAFVILALPLALLGATFGMHDACADASAASGDHVNWTRGFYVVALAIVAGVVAIRLAMLYPVIVAEGGVIAAIRRAWALSRGLFWKLVGVWLVFGLVYAVAWLAARFAFGAILGLIAPGAGPFGVTTIIAAMLVAVVRVAFTVIVAVFAALLYRAATGAGARPAA